MAREGSDAGGSGRNDDSLRCAEPSSCERIHLEQKGAMVIRLAGKVAIISGAASGMGLPRRGCSRAKVDRRCAEVCWSTMPASRAALNRIFTTLKPGTGSWRSNATGVFFGMKYAIAAHDREWRRVDGQSSIAGIIGSEHVHTAPANTVTSRRWGAH